MKCKNCEHTITIAGGMRYHIEGGFSHTCKICGCRYPEKYEEGIVDKR